MALAFAVLDLTGSARDLGVVLAARSVSNVCLLLVGGLLADRWPRHVLLVSSSLAAATSQAAVAVLVLTGAATVPWLVVLSAVNGAVAALSLPAASALTPQTVPERDLRSANALLRLGTNGTLIAGAGFGGLLVAVAGPGWGLLLDAVTFAAAAGLYARIRPAGVRVARPRQPPLTELLEGWSEFVRRRWVWVVVAQFCAVNAAFTGAMTVLGPLVAEGTVGRDGYGLVLAVQGAGLVAGGLLAIRWRPTHPLRAGVALTALTALPALALAQHPTLPVLVAAAFLPGVAIEQFGVAWDVSLQQHVTPERLARVYSYDMLGSFLAIPVGQIAVGPLAEHVGIQRALLGCAAIILVATCLALSTSSVRQLRGREGAVAPILQG